MQKELECQTSSPSFVMPDSISGLNVYHPKMDRVQAEALLKSLPSGTFLLRPASKTNSLAVSYVNFENTIRHFAFVVEGNGKVRHEKENKVSSIEEAIFCERALIWGIERETKDFTSLLKRGSSGKFDALSPDVAKQAVEQLNGNKKELKLGFEHCPIDQDHILYSDSLQVILCIPRQCIFIKRRFAAGDGELTNLNKKLEIPLFADEIILVRITRSDFEALAVHGKKLTGVVQHTFNNILEIEKFVQLQLIPPPKSIKEQEHERFEFMVENYKKLFEDSENLSLNMRKNEKRVTFSSLITKPGI